MDRIELKAEPRSVLGKKVRFLRRQGILPANVYGHADSAAIQLPVKDTEQVISRAGRTQLIDLTLDGGGPTTVMVKNWQRHPTRGSLLHVDFYRVSMTETLRVDVPIRLVGDAPAVKEHDATVFQTATTVSVESLPADLPEAIDVDVSGLTDLDSAIYVRDLQTPSGTTIVADPDELVVKLLPPTVAVEAAEEEAAEPAEAAAEGETAEASTEETAE